MNILVVDDDMLVSNALKTILESDDALHVAGSGEDGEDAVRLYGELKPDGHPDEKSERPRSVPPHSG